jgi:hypothetical protein
MNAVGQFVNAAGAEFGLLRPLPGILVDAIEALPKFLQGPGGFVPRPDDDFDRVGRARHR